MEEIDIVELFKRVKEGKAPKRIEISGVIYELNGEPDELEETDIAYLYLSKIYGRRWTADTQPNIFLDTKIKILDKPIIEELNYSHGELTHFEVFAQQKINEIIRRLNNGLKTS